MLETSRFALWSTINRLDFYINFAGVPMLILYAITVFAALSARLLLIQIIIDSNSISRGSAVGLYYMIKCD